MRLALSLILTFCLVGCGPARSAPAPMRLTSAAVGAGGRIAERQSAYGQNRSPPLSWTGVSGARTYAIVLEDPDAPGPRPFVHWTIWNIPGEATSLPEGIAGVARPPVPSGALQGANDAGGTGYFGPKPPSGVHHYRIQVFALDAPLNLPGGAGRSALSTAMNGHVIARGELAATFAAP
ncbi:MAG: YbhB/YbcL family Raf kinase inhibitor-like protein [Pseudomonadota bacterium]|nr:YbhB/YbcL family Raf kinase inhibitor-like protein [Pseudomonadota bacterium]